MDISEKIKYNREKINMSKSELARQVGVSPSYITKIENGDKTNPSMEILLKISNALKVNISELSEIDNELTKYLKTSDIAIAEIEEKKKKHPSEYKQLYNDIKELLELNDYILESDNNGNSELITIKKIDDEEVLTVRKSDIVSSGVETLKLISEFKEFAVFKLLQQLEKNN
jgi:transcriptional regulator with XRE-family HTH domain